MSVIKKLVGPVWLVAFIGLVLFSMFAGFSKPEFLLANSAWILPAMGGILVFPFVLCGIDKLFGTQISCDTFGWHNGSGGTQSFDGCSMHAVCSKCGKEVMCDSQGNWWA